ncbi:MAG: hypothetical protein WKF74_04165 [Pyrinomonadaceae bacterium]
MNCHSFRNEIEEADAPLREDVTWHLSACVSCRKLRADQLALQGLMHELEVVHAPSNFDFRVRARLVAAENVGAGKRVMHGAFAPGFLSIVLAACFALTLGIALVFKQSPRSETAMLSALSSQEAEANQTSGSSQNVHNEEEATDDSLVVNSKRKSSHEVVARIPRRVRTTAASFPSATIVSDGGGTVVSNSIGVQGAPRYTSFAENSGTGDNDVITVPVNLSAGALEVSAHDEQGEPRKMSLQSISFGAQDLVNPVGDSSRKLLSPTEGAW